MKYLACFFIHKEQDTLSSSAMVNPPNTDVYLQNLVHFQQSTQQYVPEGRTLHNHCYENLKL
jgi:hypothetical protein